MTFELCVPAYNEAAIIKDALTCICAALENSGTGWRIVVADNASTDGTGDAARSLEDPRISVLRVEKKGKGIAIIEAARRGSGDFFGFIDADLSADPSDIAPLLAMAARDGADIVIGSRLLDMNLVRRGLLRSVSSLIFNAFRHLLLGIRVEDSQCGLKIMNGAGREILASCEETGWFFDMEFLARAERAGLRIWEVPIHWDERRYAGRTAKLRVVRDGFGALRAMFRIRARLNRKDTHGTERIHAA